MNKKTVASWLDRLSEWLLDATDRDQVDPLLVAYAAAAKQAGIDEDLIGRIWEVASRDPKSYTEVSELRAIARAIRERYPEEFSAASPELR